MTNRAERAKEFFTSGYNCAQSVALAFTDVTGLTEELTARLTAGYGGGMGRLREVCGAVSGAVFVLNALEGGYAPADQAMKAALYAKIQKLARTFAEENGSYICRELLGVQDNRDPVPEKRTETYYKKRPCVELVGCAAQILSDMLENAEK